MKTRSRSFNVRATKSIFRKQTVVACAALFVAFSMVVLPFMRFYTAQAAGTITGFVFQDFNGDGNYTTTGNTTVDRLLAGVRVTAYDANGASVTTTTAANGSYSLDTATLVAGNYRVEFTNLPAGFKPSARSTNSVGAGTTTNSGSTVRFVAGGTANVNLAVDHPDDYCQNNPDLCVSISSKNDNLTGASATRRAAASYPYNSSTTFDNAYPSTTNPGTTTQLATAVQIGTTWGNAYQKSTKTVFFSAMLKRHAGFGPLGIGGIYAVKPGTTPTVSKYIDVNLLTGVNVGADPRTTAGYTLPQGTAPGYDYAAYSTIGKLSIGGLAFDNQSNTLWFVDLYNRRLHGVQNVRPGVAPTAADVLPTASATKGFAIDTATPIVCTNGVLRPWGVKVYRGLVYVGAVCSGENTGATAANLTAYVLSFNPANPGAGFSQVVSQALNYARTSGNSGSDVPWQPWVNSDLNTSAPLNSATLPQPIVSGIEFDVDGSIIMGIMDRYGNQAAKNQYRPDPAQTDTTLVPERSAFGDTLRFCNNNGVFANPGTAGCANNARPTNFDASPNQGPGGGEFYVGDWGPDPLYANIYSEISAGGLAFLPGSGQIVTTASDITHYHTGGTLWMSNTNGSKVKGFSVYGNGLSDDTNFDKLSGLGDIELLCDSAPIEIGNRVWVDSNGNGVQDPQTAAETGRAGVTVELYTGDLNNDGNTTGTGENVLIGTTTTDANGEWYFNNSNITDGDPLTAGNQPGLLPNTNYIVRIAAADFASGVGPTSGKLAKLILTKSNVVTLLTGETAGNNNADSRDSDAVSNGGRAEIPFNSSTAGSNNHTLDFGFAPAVSIGSNIFIDRNNDGIQQPKGADGIAGNADDESGISNVSVELLYDANNNGVIDGGETTAVASTVTDANGNYYFGNLPQGNYQVRIPVANFTGAGALAATPISSTTTATTDNQVDGDDNGIQTATGLETVSPIINLTAGAEPTGAQESFSGGTADDADDANGDMTIDFGFFAGYSLGNRVWFDTNNDGKIDAAEVGINGVTVTLLNSDNTVYDKDPTTAGIQPYTVTTANGGYYRFDGLPAGNYKVRVDSTNFNTGGALLGYADTTGNVTGSVDSTATSSGENGIDPTSVIGSNAASPRQAGILSNAVTLGTGANAPTGETDLGTGDAAKPDAMTDLTVDFGFYRLNLSGTVFNDGNDDGLLNNGDSGRDGVVVRLYYPDNTEVPVGPDGILGTADDTTGATNQITTANGGNYLFGNLPPGKYVVRIVTPSLTRSSKGSAPAPSPDDNVDNDDNGTPDTTAGFTNTIVGLPITLSAGDEPTITNTNGTTLNSTYDFGLVATNTAVELQSFDATSYNNGVLLEWNTGSEVNNLGFRLWRVSGAKRELVNDKLIAGSAFTGGIGSSVNAAQSYQWFDKQGTADAQYYLEDVDADGQPSKLHPANVRSAYGKNAPRFNSAALLSELGKQTDRQTEKPLLTGGKTSKTASLNRKPIIRPTPSNDLANGAAIKLAVTTNGWQRVERNALITNGLPTDANPATLQLFVNGTEKPLRVNADGSLEFYGTAIDTSETGEQIYWLSWNRTGGKRIAAIDATNVAAANENSFVNVVETRGQSVYVPSIHNGDADNFFDNVILNEPTVETINLKDVAADNYQAYAEFDVQGLTGGAHRIEFKFNEQSLGFAELTGAEFKTFRFALNQQLVREGANQIEFTEAKNGDALGISLLDASRVVYSKRTRAADGKLQFVVNPGVATLVDNFTNPNVRVFDITNDAAVTELQVAAEASGNGYAVKIPAQAAKRQFIAFDSSAAGSNPRATANAASDWRNFKTGANFVIITHKDFRAAADKLAAARIAEGLSTVVVDVEDLFDEYAYGTHSVKALREFMSGAAKWQTRPQYLLLFGDANVDARGYLNPNNVDFVPTQFVDTTAMKAASDDALTDFDNDGIADIATGRLPVRTTAQADKLITKLLAAENPVVRQKSANGAALLVADDGFETTGDDFAKALKPQLRVETVNRADNTTDQAKQKILNGINGGAKIIGFTGHGSRSIWASNQMLRVQDAVNMTNSNQLALFINLTCQNGSFADPYGDSLGEALLTAERGGAYAVWASSGMTASEAQVPMGKAIFGLYGRNINQRLGDFLRQAKQSAQDTDVRRTWTLIGDPTARVR